MGLMKAEIKTEFREMDEFLALIKSYKKRIN